MYFLLGFARALVLIPESSTQYCWSDTYFNECPNGSTLITDYSNISSINNRSIIIYINKKYDKTLTINKDITAKSISILSFGEKISTSLEVIRNCGELHINFAELVGHTLKIANVVTLFKTNVRNIELLSNEIKSDSASLSNAVIKCKTLTISDNELPISSNVYAGTVNYNFRVENVYQYNNKIIFGENKFIVHCFDHQSLIINSVKYSDLNLFSYGINENVPNCLNLKLYDSRIKYYNDIIGGWMNNITAVRCKIEISNATLISGNLHTMDCEIYGKFQNELYSFSRLILSNTLTIVDKWEKQMYIGTLRLNTPETKILSKHPLKISAFNIKATGNSSGEGITFVDSPYIQYVGSISIGFNFDCVNLSIYYDIINENILRLGNVNSRILTLVVTCKNSEKLRAADYQKIVDLSKTAIIAKSITTTSFGYKVHRHQSPWEMNPDLWCQERVMISVFIVGNTMIVKLIANPAKIYLRKCVGCSPQILENYSMEDATKEDKGIIEMDSEFTKGIIVIAHQNNDSYIMRFGTKRSSIILFIDQSPFKSADYSPQLKVDFERSEKVVNTIMIEGVKMITQGTNELAVNTLILREGSTIEGELHFEKVENVIAPPEFIAKQKPNRKQSSVLISKRMNVVIGETSAIFGVITLNAFSLKLYLEEAAYLSLDSNAKRYMKTSLIALTSSDVEFGPQFVEGVMTFDVKVFPLAVLTLSTQSGHFPVTFEDKSTGSICLEAGEGVVATIPSITGYRGYFLDIECGSGSVWMKSLSITHSLNMWLSPCLMIDCVTVSTQDTVWISGLNASELTLDRHANVCLFDSGLNVRHLRFIVDEPETVYLLVGAFDMPIIVIEKVSIEVVRNYSTGFSARLMDDFSYSLSENTIFELPQNMSLVYEADLTYNSVLYLVGSVKMDEISGETIKSNQKWKTVVIVFAAVAIVIVAAVIVYYVFCRHKANNNADLDEDEVDENIDL